MPLRSIVWNPQQEHYFSALEGSLIKLYDVYEQRTVRLRNRYDASDTKINCVAWSRNAASPLALAFACDDGSLKQIDWNAPTDEISTIIAKPRYKHRGITDIAWNPTQSNLLAVSFTKQQRSEEDVLVYDLQSHRVADSHSSELYSIPCKIQFIDKASSLAWSGPASSDQLLAVGAESGCIRLHDLRSGKWAIHLGSNNNIRKRVIGIRQDPFNAYCLATFSDCEGEPVKVWDARRSGLSNKMASEPLLSILPTHRIAETIDTNSASTSKTRSGIVWDVEWSPVHRDVLAISADTTDGIEIYSTVKPPTNDLTTNIAYWGMEPVMGYVVSEVTACSICWQSSSASAIRENKKATEAKPNVKLLLASSTGADVYVQASDAVALTVTSEMRVISEEGNSFSMHHLRSDIADAHSTMRKRCLAKHQYGLNAAENLQALSDELSSADTSSESIIAIERLKRLWEWITRLDSIADMNSDSTGASTPPGIAGIRDILESTDEESTEIEHLVLNCCMYTSHERSLCRQLCGWSVMSSNPDEVAANGCEWENDDLCERRAALALWHGSVQGCVSIIQEFIALCRDRSNEEPMGNELAVDEGYVQLLQLLAVCVAGYHAIDNLPAGHTSVWASACLDVLQQLERSYSASAAYLIACGRFLHGIHTLGYVDEASIQSILTMDGISLVDKLGFAATFLNDDQMDRCVDALLMECMEVGNVEGLVITGLRSVMGLRLLQRYLEISNDIQTVALLVARYCTSSSGDMLDISKGEGEQLDTCYNEWLRNYRQLLNKWELYMCRAALDVEIGKIGRATAAANKSSGPPASQRPQSIGRSGQRARENMSAAAGRDKDKPLVVYPYPFQSDTPHVFLGCAFCMKKQLTGSSLLSTTQRTWLQGQNPVINCCAFCKNPLPRCYICLESMGIINPTANDVIFERNRQGSITSTNSESHNSLDRGKWFMWCQQCKHGGHKSCIDSWLFVHEVCGVNGCDCKCKTDC